MNATKILWGQVLLVSAVVPSSGERRKAWRLAFQPELGRPWFNLLGWPVYQPPAFFWWWFAYDAYARGIFIEGAYIGASGGIAAVLPNGTVTLSEIACDGHFTLRYHAAATTSCHVCIAAA
jgi:type IV secretion system protein VirD4